MPSSNSQKPSERILTASQKDAMNEIHYVNNIVNEVGTILDEFELRISALETSKNRVYKFDKLEYHPHDPQEKCTGNCPQ